LASISCFCFNSKRAFWFSARDFSKASFFAKSSSYAFVSTGLAAWAVVVGAAGAAYGGAVAYGGAAAAAPGLAGAGASSGFFYSEDAVDPDVDPGIMTPTT